MYSSGASERRLGELTRGKDVVIASKFPGTLFFRTENMPKELDASLKRLDVPRSIYTSITFLPIGWRSRS